MALPEPEKRMMRIAYFGGSFNPPHLGHVAVAAAALAQHVTDQVLMAPAWLPPHKQRQPNLASFADRLRMVELAVRGREGLEACAVEGEWRLEPSYTIEVLARLQERYPECELQLLIGGDSLLQLHSWYRAEELVSRYGVITYPRRDQVVSEEALARHWKPEIARKLAAGQLSGSFFEISSTEIRKKLENREEAKHIMNQEVIAYIVQRGLYRRGAVLPGEAGVTSI